MRRALPTRCHGHRVCHAVSPAVGAEMGLMGLLHADADRRRRGALPVVDPNGPVMPGRVGFPAASRTADSLRAGGNVPVEAGIAAGVVSAGADGNRVLVERAELPIFADSIARVLHAVIAARVWRRGGAGRAAGGD